MEKLKISELPSCKPEETGFKDMAVTISNEEVRRVHVGAHVYLDEDDAVHKIKAIYKSGKVPFILAVEL